MTSQKTATPAPEARAEAMGKIDVARAIYEAFGRGAIARVLELFDAGIEFREAEGNPYRPDGTPWVGPEMVLNELFVKLGQEWAGFTVTPLVMTETTDGVVTEGRYTGTYKPTGRTIDMQICHVLRIRDGRLTHFQQYADTAALQWAMGYTPSR
jgi:ketosteroid isomerase-like protein